MARPHLGTRAHTITVSVKLTTTETANLDRIRDGHTRSAFLRALINKATTEVVVASTTRPEGAPPSRRTPPRPPRPALTVVDRHLHRYVKDGDPLRYHQGGPIYRYVCECGAEKEDT